MTPGRASRRASSRTRRPVSAASGERQRSGGPERSGGERAQLELAHETASLVCGRNPVRELLRAGRRRPLEVLATPRRAEEEWLDPVRDRLRVVERSLLDELTEIEHQGIVAFAEPYPYVDSEELLAAEDALVIALDQVQDPRNLGAVCRVADAVGASGVVICKRRAAAVTSVVCRASAGAVEHVRVARVGSLPQWLEWARAAGAWSYLADVTGEPWHRFDYRGRAVLVFGSEGAGSRKTVRRAVDATVALEQAGAVSSLNVATACAALAYGVRWQRCGLIGQRRERS